MKNKVLIIVIICVLIIGLIGVGIFSYKKHSNGSKKKGPGWGTPEERGVVIESPEEDFDSTPTMIFSSEEFMSSVTNDYGKEGVTYKLTKDNDGCYEAKGSDGSKYSYCLGDSSIEVN